VLLTERFSRLFVTDHQEVYKIAYKYNTGPKCMPKIHQDVFVAEALLKTVRGTRDDVSLSVEFPTEGQLIVS
jgi:hypothetical protein